MPMFILFQGLLQTDSSRREPKAPLILDRASLVHLITDGAPVQFSAAQLKDGRVRRLASEMGYDLAQSVNLAKPDVVFVQFIKTSASSPSSPRPAAPGPLGRSEAFASGRTVDVRSSTLSPLPLDSAPLRKTALPPIVDKAVIPKKSTLSYSTAHRRDPAYVGAIQLSLNAPRKAIPKFEELAARYGNDGGEIYMQAYNCCLLLIDEKRGWTKGAPQYWLDYYSKRLPLERKALEYVQKAYARNPSNPQYLQTLELAHSNVQSCEKEISERSKTLSSNHPK